MSREHWYRIEMRDGSVREMTAKQISEEMGIDLSRVKRRLQRRGVRTEDGLRESAESASSRARQTFLRGTTAHFMEMKRKRAAEAAHMEEVESGHAKL